VWLALAAVRARPKMQTAPSAERNKEPIALVLAKYPPFSGSQQTSCLELASGTGQHAAHFASRFPHVTFQPSEYAGGSSGPEAAAYGTLSPVFASIVAHTGGMANVLRPIELDAAADTWPVEADAACAWNAVYACNVCHISPWRVTEGLLRGASRVLSPSNGHAFIYGPFKINGQHTAASNEAFDMRLRAQNAEWGVRDAAEVAEVAAAHGLSLVATEEMPANNFVLVFKRQP